MKILFLIVLISIFSNLGFAERPACGVFWPLLPLNHEDRVKILTPELKSKLEKLRSLVIKEFSSLTDGDLPQSPFSEGMVVSVNGKKYQLIELLGKGGEAYVFKAKRDGKFFSVKTFREGRFHKKAIDRLEKLRDSGVRTPEIVDVDSEIGVVVMEYVHGVPVWGFTTLTQRGEIFSTEDLSFFADSFNVWIAQQHKEASSFDGNTVLNFGNDGLEFVLVDPR